MREGEYFFVCVCKENRMRLLKVCFDYQPHYHNYPITIQNTYHHPPGHPHYYLLLSLHHHHLPFLTPITTIHPQHHHHPPSLINTFITIHHLTAPSMTQRSIFNHRVIASELPSCVIINIHIYTYIKHHNPPLHHYTTI